jgi:hypothetical protein
MYGFNHYDKDLKVLGSTGIDIATTDTPLYIEVTGAFVPGVTTNITTTALTKANADAMKAVIEKAGGAVLYGEKTTTFGQEHSHSETGGGISEVGETGNPSGLVESGSSSGGPKSGEVYENSSAPFDPSFLIVDGATSGKFDVIPVKIKSGGSGYEFEASRTPEVAYDVAADQLFLSIGRDPTKKADASNSDASAAEAIAKTAKLLNSISVFRELHDAFTFKSAESGLTLVDKKDSDIFNVIAPSENTPAGTEVFEIKSIGEKSHMTAHVTAKTDGNSTTYSNVYTHEVSGEFLFAPKKGEPIEPVILMDRYFSSIKIKGLIDAVQLREVYSKGDSTVPDHHWLTAEFLDPSDQIIATSGVSLGSGDKSYIFKETGSVSIESELLNKSNFMSPSDPELVEDAFFDVFEEIVLDSTPGFEFGGH